MKLARVEIVAHPKKPGLKELQRDLETFLTKKGVEVDGGPPDLVISLGGDGTTLRAAQRAHVEDAPLLGVNRGFLGYLNEVEAGDETSALERVLAGEFTIEERMMLACTVGDDSYVGLNEVLVERSARRRLVHLGVEVGGERLAGFDADGVLVATPTGSTAYALSAGGPIVDPRAECLVIVPVSPHMIFSRPVVLSPKEVVTITVDETVPEDAVLSIDGRLGCDLEPGAVVDVRRHPRPIRLVKLGGPGFVERLRTKMRLPT